jgi:hypothetical protein
MAPFSPRSCSLVLLLVLSGCPAPTGESVPRATCNELLAGLSWGDDAPPEAQGVEEAELTESVWASLSDPIDISQLVGIDRGLIAYALEIPPNELGATLSHAEALEQGMLGRVVLASIARSDNPAWMDLDFFRRGFQRYYTCSKAYPTTLDGFRSAIFQFEESGGTTVNSVAKCAERRLITGPNSGVHIAQTIVDGRVEETEIILESLRNDGQLDFVVYDDTGTLTDRSIFPNLGGEAAVMGAPYSCMSCHFNVRDEVWSYDLVLADSGICQNE